MKKLVTVFIMLFMIGSVFATVENFPEPFVVDNSLDGAIVIAESGNGEDVLSGLLLASSLSPFTQSVIETGGDDGSKMRYRIENTGDVLQGGEGIGQVRDKLTENELAILASGTLKNRNGEYPYAQYIKLNSDTKVRHTIPDAIPKDPNKKASAFLNFDGDKVMYEYELVFSEAAESEMDENYMLKDLEGVQLNMLGKSYVITKTDHETANDLTITLLSESVRATMKEGETKTFTLNGEDYEITAVLVSGDQEVKFIVNGETLKKMASGELKRLEEGLVLYTKDVMINEREAIVDFYLGVDEIELHDTDVSDHAYGGEEYKFGNERVDDTDVIIEAVDEGLVEGGNFKIKSIGFKWTPRRTHFIGGGQFASQILEDPNQIFDQTFDISYEGSEKVLEGVQLKPSGDDEYILSLTNKLGDVLDIPFFYDNGGSFTRFGDANDALILDEGDNITVDDYFIVTSDGYAEPVDAHGYTHLLTYEGLDISQKVMKFKDHGTGDRIEVDYNLGDSSLYLNLMGYDYLVTFDNTTDDSEIQVDLDGDGSINDNETPVIVTQYGLGIDYDISGTYAYRRYRTYTNERSEPLIGEVIMNAQLYGFVGPNITTTYSLNNSLITNPSVITKWYDVIRYTIGDDGGEIDVTNLERCLDGGAEAQIRNAVTNSTYADDVVDLFYEGICYPTSTNTLKFMLDVERGSDDNQGTTAYGQLLKQLVDKNGPDTLLLFSGLEESKHKVVFHGKTGGVKEPKTLSVISSPDVATLLDNDVTEIDQNMIVIGGPCVNGVAKKVLGSSDDCSADFPPGKGRIIVKEVDGNQVIVIAGYEGEDTLLATKLLLEKPELLTGDNLLVSGTFDNPIIEEYVGQKHSGDSVEVVAVPAETPVEEQESDIFSCTESNDETGSFEYELSKLGITKQVSSNPRVLMDGNKGEVIFEVSEPFKAQLGTDWLQYVVHVHEGDCTGKEVETLTFKWEDGDGDKSESLKLDPGCYCLTVGPEDLSVDDADIKLTSELELMFSTRTPETDLLTGNVVFDTHPLRPLNNMNVWE